MLHGTRTPSSHYLSARVCIVLRSYLRVSDQMGDQVLISGMATPQGFTRYSYTKTINSGSFLRFTTSGSGDVTNFIDDITFSATGICVILLIDPYPSAVCLQPCAIRRTRQAISSP